MNITIRPVGGGYGLRWLFMQPLVAALLLCLFGVLIVWVRDGEKALQHWIPLPAESRAAYCAKIIFVGNPSKHMNWIVRRSGCSALIIVEIVRASRKLGDPRKSVLKWSSSSFAWRQRNIHGYFAGGTRAGMRRNHWKLSANDRAVNRNDMSFRRPRIGDKEAPSYRYVVGVIEQHWIGHGNIPDYYSRPLGKDEGLAGQFRSFCCGPRGFLSGFSGAPGFYQTVSHDFRLLADSAPLEERNAGQYSCENGNDPVSHRGPRALICLFLFGSGAYGGQPLIDNHKRLCGNALVWGSYGLFVTSLLLLLLSGYSWSWRWWL